MTAIASRILAIAVTISIAGLAIPATMATAAEPSGEVQLSSDGVTYGSHFSGSLFDSIAHLVPGDSDSERFYLRNSGNAPGFLRITLRDVVSTNTDFAQALTVTASTPGYTGSPVTIGAADPCWILLEGQRVEPGQTVGVTTKLALGNLDGLAGQGATAALSIRVALSDTATGALPPTDCGRTGADIPVVPAIPTPGKAPGATPDNDASAIPPVTPSHPIDPTPEESGSELPVLPLPIAHILDPNTWHLYEELLVFVLLASFVLGSGWFMIGAWRRRRRDEAEMDVTA